MKKMLKRILLSFVCMVVVGITPSYPQSESKMEQMQHLESLKLPSNAFQARWQAKYVELGLGLDLGFDRFYENWRIIVYGNVAWRVFMIDIGCSLYDSYYNSAPYNYRQEISDNHYYDYKVYKEGRYMLFGTPQFYYYYFSAGWKFGTLLERNTTYKKEILQETLGNNWCITETIIEDGMKTEINGYFVMGPVLKLFPNRWFGGSEFSGSFISIGYDVFFNNGQYCKEMNGLNFGVGFNIEL